MRKKLFCMLLVFLLSVSWGGSCFAAYTMTEAELTRLEEIFAELKINNRALQAGLAASKLDLITAQTKLAESEQQLETLQTQLTQLREESSKAKAESIEAQTLLTKANQSLDRYEREVKQKINKLTWQRNVLVIGILAAAVKT